MLRETRTERERAMRETERLRDARRESREGGSECERSNEREKGRKPVE